MDNDRLKHSLAVARKMVEIGKFLNLDEEELNTLFIIGFNHDIGYEFVTDTSIHNIVGGAYLRKCGFKYYKEIYYHGIPDSEYNSLYLDILNKADMEIDKYGNDVGFDKRLDDIKSRYGEDSNVYSNCKKLIRNIKNNFSKYNNGEKSC